MRGVGSRAMLRKLVSAGLLGLLGGIAFVSTLHAEPVTLRLGYTGAGDEQLWLLVARPDLVAENYGKVYTFDATRFSSADKRAQAFEADAIDLAAMASGGVIFAAAEGVTAKIIASISRESASGFRVSYYVKADSPIKSVKDLKGKLVGLNGFSNAGQLELDTALEKDDLSDTDVTITPVPFPAMQEALAASKIDLGEFPQPYAALMEAQMKVRKLFDSRYGMPFDQELIVLIGKDAFLKKNAIAVRALLEDLKAATRFYLDHPREARQALIDAKMVRVTPDVYMNMQDYYRDPTLRPDVDALEETQEFMIKAAFQKKRADIRSMVDTSYLPK